MLLSIVEGWTGPLGPFTLRIDGVPTTLVGMTVVLKLRNALGAVVVPTGTVDVRDQALYPGQVFYTPAASDFVFPASVYGAVHTYRTHWQVTDIAGKVVFFPNGAPDEIGVYRA